MKIQKHSSNISFAVFSRTWEYYTINIWKYNFTSNCAHFFGYKGLISRFTMDCSWLTDQKQLTINFAIEELNQWKKKV